MSHPSASGEWKLRQSFPKICLKSFDCFGGSKLSVEGVKTHSGDKADEGVLMQSPKNNSSPAGARPEWFTLEKQGFNVWCSTTVGNVVEKKQPGGPGLLQVLSGVNREAAEIILRGTERQMECSESSPNRFPHKQPVNKQQQRATENFFPLKSQEYPWSKRLISILQQDNVS